jgi:hypothetical protein
MHPLSITSNIRERRQLLLERYWYCTTAMFYGKLESNCCIWQSVPAIGGRRTQRLIQICSLRMQVACMMEVAFSGMLVKARRLFLCAGA